MVRTRRRGGQQNPVKRLEREGKNDQLYFGMTIDS